VRSLIITIALPIPLVLSGCGGSGEPDDAGQRATALITTSSAPAGSPSAEDDALADVCAERCQLLADAQNGSCPEPVTNVSLCVPYLTNLSQAVYDVQDALDQTPYASRDYPDLLAAVASHTESVEAFAAERCYEVTAASVDSGFSCGIQPLAIIWSAATVGLELQMATERP
jgi:hypothetical protein